MKEKPTEKKLLRQRWGELDTEFSSWLSTGQELSRYILPRSGRFVLSDRNQGAKRHNNILDSTATKALRILAAGLMSGGSSPARPWFRLATADQKILRSSAVKTWLDQVMKLMSDVFQRSNTYRALHTMYEELGVFGTSACLVLDDFQDVIRLYPLTYGEYRIATNERNEVDTLYRRFEMTISAIVKEYGYENCSTNVQSLYDTGALGKWVTVYHVIEPRIDREPDKKDSKNMPWKSIHFEEGGDDDKFLRVGGFKRFRVLAPRWSLSGGDIYGNGPGAESIGDVKQLQHEQLRKAECIDYKTRPPLQSPTSTKNREIDRLPGGNTYVDMTGPNQGIKTMFEVNLDLQHLLMDIQDVRQRINETFYKDLFLMLANDNRSGITATEVAERHEEKLLMLGPVLERLHNELLDPLVTMTFDSLLEAGLVPTPPEELQGTQLNIEFTSMLAQAQRAVSVSSTDRFVNGLLMLAAGGKPEVLDKLNADEWADDYGDSLGINPKLINDQEVTNAVRQQRAQAQQAAQQAAMAQQAAQTAHTLGNTPTGGAPNALTDIAQQAA